MTHLRRISDDKSLARSFGLDLLMQEIFPVLMIIMLGKLLKRQVTESAFAMAAVN